MTTTSLHRKRLALAIGTLLSSTPALAFDFEIYDIDASFSTTLTLSLIHI